MAQTISAALAFILTYFGFMLFKQFPYTNSNGLFAPCDVFLFAVFVFVWNHSIYPRWLRKQKSMELFVELLVIKFIMELLLLEFWVPLEKNINGAFTKLGDGIEIALEEPQFEELVDIYWSYNSTLGIICNYFISVVLLFVILHITRIIDLRILEYGIIIFLNNLFTRLIRMPLYKLLSYIGTKRQLTHHERTLRRPNQIDECCYLSKVGQILNNFKNRFKSN